MRDLVGKTALVTGGGKGVGKEIARSLASRGADVIINCFHSYAIAKATKAELEEATGARISLMRGSVAKVEQVRQLFEQVEAEHGGLDILVNNAASGRLGPSPRSNLNTSRELSTPTSSGASGAASTPPP